MFTADVIEQLKYYVYRLIDPRTGTTFYVGKGKGNRLYAHVNGALKNYEGESYLDDEEDDISSKIQQIREIRNAGLEVIHVIHRYGLTEKEAFEVEAALIDCYPGLTNVHGGYSSDRGVNNASVIQRNLSAEEFKDVYELNYCIIKINDYWLNERYSVYETVRKHWKVNLKRIKNTEYVLAVHRGIVVDVFKAEIWYEAPDVIGRCMFDGTQAEDEVRNLFINKRLPKHYMKKGMAAPVLYHDNYNKHKIKHQERFSEKLNK